MAPVLLVEDDARLRHILARNLERRGYSVAEADTVAGARASCVAARPAVLILDITLPDGSGWDVLRSLAARDGPWLRVVAISAAPPPRRRLTEFSPLTFLQKPFALATLLQAVERAAVEARCCDGR